MNVHNVRQLTPAEKQDRARQREAKMLAELDAHDSRVGRMADRGWNCRQRLPAVSWMI